MFTYEGETTIARPAEEVFAFAADPENLPKWTDTSQVEVLTDGPMGLGTRLKVTMGKGPLRATADFETSEWEENRSWTYKTIPPHWLLWDATYRVEPIDASSSKFSTSGQISISGFRRLLEPLVRGELAKGEQAELERLKAIVEGQTTPEG
jgi:uncharacterized protein YndB with AHSA1/START domain